MEKVKGFVVVLEHDLPLEAAESIMEAISLIRDVESVAISAVNPDDLINRARVKSELIELLADQISDYSPTA